MDTRNKLRTAKIPALFFSLAMPAIIGQIVSLLYNLVDRIYIGHIPVIGKTALAGVGITAPIIIIISSFAQLIGSGGAPIASIRMGEKKHDRAEAILGTALVSLLGISVVLMMLLIAFMDPLLYQFGASADTISYARSYLQIYAFGTPFVMLTLGLNPFITAQGFARTSMLTVTIGAVLNIILDPILMFGLNMGVQGAALATIISQGVSAIWVYRFLRGEQTTLQLKKDRYRILKNELVDMVKLGLSPFVMNTTESFILIAFNTSMLRYGGVMAVSAMTILTSSMQMTVLPLLGLTQGAQPIISYNFGADDLDRVRQTFRILLKACLVFSIGISVSFQLFPSVFVRFFTSDPELIDLSVKGLRIYTAGVWALGIQIACQQTFIALENAKTSLFLAVLRKIILLIPLIYLLPMLIQDKFTAVLLAEPVSDILAAMVTATLFFIGFRALLADRMQTAKE